jgi:DNA-binding NarL/FixJ family response regulator
VLWIAFHERLFSYKLAKRLELIKGTYKVVSPEELLDLPLGSHDIVIAEIPELLWCDCKLALNLFECNAKVVAVGFLLRSKEVALLENYSISAYIDEDSTIEYLKEILNKLKFQDKIEQKAVRQKLLDVLKELNTSEHNLTDHELDLIYRISKEQTNKEIAEATKTSKRTVDNRRLRLYEKLQIKSTAGLVRWAFNKRILFASIGSEFFQKFLKK